MKALSFVALLLAVADVRAGFEQRGRVAAEEKWCTADSDCAAGGDVKATCSPAGDCVCSPNYGYKVINEVETKICFPYHRTVEVVVKFTSAPKDAASSCHSTYIAEKAMKPRMVAILNEWSGGRTVNLAVVCSQKDSDNRLYAAATIEVPTQCFANGRDTCSDQSVIATGFAKHVTLRGQSSATQITSPELCQTLCQQYGSCQSWSWWSQVATPFQAFQGTTDTSAVGYCKLCRDPILAAPEKNTNLVERNGVIAGPRDCPPSTSSRFTNTVTEASRLDTLFEKKLADSVLLSDALGKRVQVSVAFNQEKSTACIPTTGRTPSTGAAPRTVIDVDFTVGTENCQATRCPVGYYPTLNKNLKYKDITCIALDPLKPNEPPTTATNLVEPARGTCFVDGDCSWEALKTQCANETCVVPAAHQTLRLRKPTVIDKNWCYKDADCRVYGDALAECEHDTGLGNWCKCTSAFDYPIGFVSICIDKNLRPSHIKYSFSLSFTQAALPCPVSEEQVGAVRRLLTAALGDIVTLRAPACANQLVEFIGTINVPKTLAARLAEVNDPDFLKKRFQHEIERVASRAASTLGAYPELTWRGTPVAASVGAPFACETPQAAASRTDGQGVCQAVECNAQFELVETTGVFSCVVPRNATVVAVESNDDDLTDGQITGVVFGVILFVAVVVAVVLFVSAKPAEHQPVGEPTKEEEV
eukprot:Rhum_TRINITY_DN14096_c6_g1::Rhum_TRINITY_DN14096_c6_g1_i1::g.67438::m.67438